MIGFALAVAGAMGMTVLVLLWLAVVVITHFTDHE